MCSGHPGALLCIHVFPSLANTAVTRALPSLSQLEVSLLCVRELLLHLIALFTDNFLKGLVENLMFLLPFMPIILHIAISLQSILEPF